MDIELSADQKNTRESIHHSLLGMCYTDRRHEYDSRILQQDFFGAACVQEKINEMLDSCGRLPKP